MKKLPYKFKHVLGQFLLAICMTCLMSGIVTFFSLGLTEGFFDIWMANYLRSFCIAFPILLVVAPVVRKIVETICETE